MSILHFFVFAETSCHPMIRKWKSPKTASSFFGGIQLCAGLMILLLLDYRFEIRLSTLCLVLGFIAWGVVRGAIADRKDKKA
jgi:hypothetical protein